MEKSVLVTETTISKKMAHVIAGLIHDTKKEQNGVEIALMLTLLGAAITEDLNKELFNEK